MDLLWNTLDFKHLLKLLFTWKGSITDFQDLTFPGALLIQDLYAVEKWPTWPLCMHILLFCNVKGTWKNWLKSHLDFRLLSKYFSIIVEDVANVSVIRVVKPRSNCHECCLLIQWDTVLDVQISAKKKMISLKSM